MALGEKLGDEKGKIIGQRVIPNPNGGAPRMEVSFRSQGQILGMDANTTATYWAEPRGNYFWGEGQGLVMLKDGEMVSWKGNGVGRPMAGGKGMQWRGCIYFETQPGTKHARLNGVAACFEDETDAEGNHTGVFWEWR